METLPTIRKTSVFVVCGLFFGMFLVFAPMPAQAYTDFYITGTVYNVDLYPIPNVTVTCLKQGTNETLTDETNQNGEYSINLAGFQSGYDPDDVFILYKTTNTYATVVTGCGLYVGQQTIGDCDIFGPVYTNGDWIGNYGMASRSASYPAFQNIVAANPYNIDTDSQTWSFYAGWGFTDYNEHPTDTLHVDNGQIVWKLSHGIYSTWDTATFQYDLDAGLGLGNSGWLGFTIASGSYSGWCTFSMTFTGTYHLGAQPPSLFTVQYNYVVNIQWI
jgi:hypothetical protein